MGHLMNIPARRMVVTTNGSLTGHLEGQNTQGIMDAHLDCGAHQCSVVEGDPSILKGLDLVSTEEACVCKDRQHVSSITYFQVGTRLLLCLQET